MRLSVLKYRNILKTCSDQHIRGLGYSRAYIRHLFVAEEMLAMRLSVMHNLYFYNKLMEKIRQALDEGRFEDFRREYSEKLGRRI